MPGAAIFQATCPGCEQTAKFIELKVEACVQPDGGPPKAWQGFKCLACNQRTKEVEGADGVHRFVDGRHVIE